MGKTKDLGHLASMALYDASGNMTLPANLKINGSADVATQAYVGTQLGSYTPSTRSITINGTTYDLSADRSWTITSMIYPASGIALSTGSAWGTSITNNSANWNTAYGWGNHASAGYATTSSLSSYLPLSGGTLTGSLYQNSGFMRTTGYMDVSPTVGAFRFYDGTTFVGGLGTGSWAAVGASNDVIMYLNGVNYYISNGSTSLLKVATNGVVTFTNNIYLGNSSSYAFGTGYWAGAGGYPGYQYTGGNSRFGFSSTSGYIDVYTDGNFYAGIDLNGSNNLVLHTGNYSSYALPLSGGILTGNLQINPVSASWAEGLAFYMPTTNLWGGLRWQRGRSGYDGNWALGYTGLDSSDDFVFVANNGGAQINDVLRLSKAGYLSTKTGDNSYHYFGPNSTWSGALYIGATPNKIGSLTAQVVSTDGSLHVDSATSKPLYLNYFSNQTIYVRGTMQMSGYEITEVANVYNRGWFRNYGDSGLYNQDYGCHFRRSVSSSYGNWETFGYEKNSWSGFSYNYNYLLNLMSNSSGDHGFYQENGNGWTLFYNRANNCWGIGTDNTYSGDGFRCVKYGSAQYGWTTWSDRRAKENISTINGALDTVLAMRGVYYNYIKDEAKIKRVGFIAQELMEVLPEAVRYAEEIDEYNINYDQIVSVLAEAIKEQNNKIERLESLLETLTNK